MAAYRATGNPRYPTQDQIRRLNAETQLPPPSRHHLEGNRLDLSLEANTPLIVEAGR
ncbi:MAG: hypothetical protein ACRD4P_09980 [Bryobacteraceae bacterium]